MVIEPSHNIPNRDGLQRPFYDIGRIAEILFYHSLPRHSPSHSESQKNVWFKYSTSLLFDSQFAITSQIYTFFFLFVTRLNKAQELCLCSMLDLCVFVHFYFAFQYSMCICPVFVSACICSVVTALSRQQCSL